MKRLLLLLLCAVPVQAQPYDLVIQNGKIVDGSGNPWFHGDVAVRGNKIVALGQIPPGIFKRTIDAKGLVVAPGFIDIHAHSEHHLIEDGAALSKITQGVTTEVFGENNSPGPYLGKLKPPGVRVKDETVTWKTLGEYFDLADKRGFATNVASFVGLGTVWQCVMGDSHARPSAAQLGEMKKLVADAMKQGAAGVSTMLAMPPGSLAHADELVELCKVAAAHGGIFVVHIRNEGTDVLAALKEVIEIARKAGIQLEILHIKIADQKLWGKMNEVVDLVNKARQAGVNVQANLYPYTRGHNNLASIIPPWAHEGGKALMLQRLKKDRERLRREIKDGIPGWYNHYTAVGGDWARMLLTGTSGYGGLTMDRVLAERSKGKANPDLFEEFLDFLGEQEGSVPAIFEHHAEKDMRLAMQQPWCGIGSDGYAHALEGPLRRGHPHPRSFGTFPRVLGLYVRELGLITLEEAVRKMTSLNAQKIGAHDRGLLRVGFAADITIFDPQRVIDRSTFTQPFQLSEGIEYVVVNGVLAIDQGKATGAQPGVSLRRGSAVSQKGS